MHKVKTNDGEFIIYIDEHNLSLYKRTDPSKFKGKHNDSFVEGSSSYLLVGYYNPNKPDTMLKDIIRFNILSKTDNNYIELEKYIKTFVKYTNKLIKEFNLTELEANDDVLVSLKKENKLLKSTIGKLNKQLDNFKRVDKALNR